MRKPKSWPLWIALLVVVAAAVMLYLRFKAPPEAARLLPEADAMLYLRLNDVRTLTHFDQQQVTRSADLQQFIDATGIVPERDLDAVALALHRMPDPHGPNGPVAYTEVFVGKFDGARLNGYLAARARGTESYSGHTIYSLGIEGRTLRVSQLGYDMVAASNMPTPEQIHSILDRYRAGASPFTGSSLLGARFGDVPLLAQAWGIGRIGLPFGENGRLSLMGMELPMPADTVFVASIGPAVRLSGAVRLRVEEIAPDTLSAQHTAETVGQLLGILRGVAGAQEPHNAADAAMRSILASATIEQRDDRVVATAGASPEQVRALAAAHPQTDDLP